MTTRADETSESPVRLPPALSFLLRHGVEESRLREALRLAEGCGACPADTALAADLVAPERFYGALAREIGLPYLAPGFAAHALARYPEAIVRGIVPLADSERAAFALAPRGEAIEGLLARRDHLAASLAICSPAGLREAVFRARPEAIARAAAEALVRTSPEHSYHAGLSVRQTLALLAAFSLAGLSGWIFGPPAYLVVMVLVGSPFLALAAIKIAAVLDPAPIGVPTILARTPDRELPVYTVLVPLHREERVLPRLRAALLRLDYPAARLDVKLLLEADDAQTLGALARLPWPGFVEIVAVPPGRPRTKPRALNVGLALARGRYVVVYDAEDEPDPDQLRAAVGLFERLGPEVACLQARLVIDNTDDTLLTRFFTVEYGGLFDVLNPALARFDLPVPLGGTSNHLKTDVLRALGGWDPWNVTEDADLGIRLALAGHRVADLPSSTHEEAPSRLRPWLAQRARWMKGFVQVAITHSRDPLAAARRLGPWRFAGASLLVGGAVLSSAIYPVFALLVAVQLASGAFFEHDTALEVLAASLSLVLLCAGLLAIVLPSLAALRRRGWLRLLPFALLMPLYHLLVSLGAWRGLLELLLDPDRWNKTEHGLARTSRRGRDGPEA